MSVTTSACADSQPPTAPGNVTASTRTTTSIALTWAAATDNIGVAGYGVYNGADLVNTTAGTTGIVSGLTCGTNYTLAVDAFDATGNSSPKTTIMVSTLPCTDTTPPTQPTNLRATAATTTSVTLAWNASTDNVGVAGYDIYRASTKVGTATTTSLHDHRAHLRNHIHRRRQSARHAPATPPRKQRPRLTTSPAPPSTQSCPLPAYPDANCTGVPAGTTLTPSGGLTITTAGTVIDGRDITGQVVVNAPNVTIRNSRIRSNAMFADRQQQHRAGRGGQRDHQPARVRTEQLPCRDRQQQLHGPANRDHGLRERAGHRRPRQRHVRGQLRPRPRHHRPELRVGQQRPHTDGIQIVRRSEQHRDPPQLDRPGRPVTRWGARRRSSCRRERPEVERLDRGQLPRRSQRVVRDLRAAAADTRHLHQPQPDATSGYGYTACVQAGDHGHRVQRQP